MLKITEIIVAKIKILGQDGWILTKFAKKKKEQGQYTAILTK